MVQFKKLNMATSIFIHLIFFVLLCSLETIFIDSKTSFIELDLWMVSLVFFGLYRRIETGLIFVLISSLLFGSFSAIPYHLSFISFLMVFASIHLIKHRSFTNGSAYFVICSSVSVLVFYVSMVFMSWLLGENPISHPHIVKWITSALTSSALFIFIRPVLVFIDRTFKITYPFGFEV